MEYSALDNRPLSFIPEQGILGKEFFNTAVRNSSRRHL